MAEPHDLSSAGVDGFRCFSEAKKLGFDPRDISRRVKLCRWSKPYQLSRPHNRDNRMNWSRSLFLLTIRIIVVWLPPPCSARERVMWLELYRCSVIAGTVWVLGVSAAPVLGQQRIPVPAPEPVSASQPIGLAEGTNGPWPTIDAWTLDRLHAPLLRDDLKINGAASCATSNCHAGPRPGVLDLTAKRSMEYQVWIENDPHSRSWRTICGEESLAMMRRLGILEGKRIVDQAGFDNCLACHNSTRRFDEPRFTSTAKHDANGFLREGVGCSACHGPSERWIGTHFQAGWSGEVATGDGFVDASDLYVRARMCASCHVGDKDRDMNHDIIAAGHPTLRYELATFHAWQPKHWRDHEANDKTAYEARLWLAGQVAATDASLALLETRAKDAHTVSKWPEFAAYNCASCHHNLGLDNDREGIKGARRATAIYSQWNDAGLRWLIDYRISSGEATEEDTALLEAMDRVRDEMERRPRPQSDAVAAASAEARVALADWFDGRPGLQERSHFRSDRLGRVIADAAGRSNTFRSWESAVQFYLAAVAARESWPGGWNGPMREVADQMQYGLQYPQMIDISRYAKRARAQGPQSTRKQITAMGIELASVLGPVNPSAVLVESGVDPADERRRLNQIIQEVNEQWRERREAYEKAMQKAPDIKNDKPAPVLEPPKSIDELMQERNRNKSGPLKPNE